MTVFSEDPDLALTWKKLRKTQEKR